MMAGPRPVIGFGAYSVDDFLYVNAPLSAGKGRVVRRARAFGGNVATALVAVARLGGAASFIGWLDAAADTPALLDLEANGVWTADAPRAPGCEPIRAVITVGSDGDRFIAFDDNVRLGTRPDLPDAVLEEAGALLIDGYATLSIGIVERARALGVPVIADIEWSIGEATDRLLALADHLVLPLDFACRHTGQRRAGDALSALWSEERAAVILTDGARGVHLLGPDAVPRHLPSHEVEVVDTTGAGDCFHGAYALSLVRGLSLLDGVRFAVAAAALSTCGLGRRGALPSSPEVERLLAAPGAPACPASP